MSEGPGTTSATTAGRARIGEWLLIAAEPVVGALFAGRGRASAKREQSFTNPRPTAEAMRLPRC